MAIKKINDKTLKMYYNAREWQKLAEDDAEVKNFLRFLATQKPESELEEDIMEQVIYARGKEPWRKEFFYVRDLQERGRKEGYKEGKEDGRKEAQAQLAADQAEIAALKAEVQALRSQLAAAN